MTIQVPGSVVGSAFENDGEGARVFLRAYDQGVQFYTVAHRYHRVANNEIVLSKRASQGLLVRRGERTRKERNEEPGQGGLAGAIV